MSKYFDILDSLVLGQRPNERVPLAEQQRQRAEAEDILSRLGRQPGVVLADEVGMGKTFVALAAAYCVGVQGRKGPVPIHYCYMFPDGIGDLVERAVESSLPTHASPQCLSACVYLTVVLGGSIDGRSREEVLDPAWEPMRLARKDMIEAIQAGLLGRSR